MSCIPIQDFSLITLCDATKAGKLYSIVPDTGAGDLDVTRASTATYLGSDGLLKTAATDEPRIEFNADGSYKGLLVEPAATNLLLRSEEFDDGYWVKANVSVTANDAVAPDGTMTADLITANPDAFQRVERVFDFLSLGDNATVTISVFAKKQTTNSIGLMGRDKSNNGPRANFNLDTLIAYPDAGVTAKVEELSNGWRRCSMSYNIGTGSEALSSFRIAQIIPNDFNAPGLPSVAASGDSLLIWGAQLEVGTVATSYIQTVASTVTRAADVISQDLSGVLPSTYSLILKVNADGGRLRMDDGTTGFDIDLTGTGQIVANVEANTITFTFPDNGQPTTELVFEKYTDFNDLEFVQKIAGLHVEVIAMTNSVLSASEIADKVFGSVSTSFIETDWGAQTSFAGVFLNRGYEFFPLIDTSSGTTFGSTWRDNNLTSFPLIDTSSATVFANAWFNNNLTSFPLIDTSSGTNLNNAFRNNNLTSFPLIDTSSVTNFNAAWLDNNLTSFPLIDTSLGQGFFFAWRNNNLTSFPLIDTSSGTAFESAWRENNLQTWPANMFDNCPATNFTAAWFINALDATGVNNILISINKARVDGVSSGTGTIGLDGGTNAAPTGAGLTAKNELIAAGWTVNTN